LEYLYTFYPRGGVAGEVFRRFSTATGNPILNNFKALDRLSHDWAMSRDDNPRQSAALVDIILGLSALPFRARRGLAATLRQALLRLIELEATPEVILQHTRRLEDIDLFMAEIAVGNTGTAGVLEQRVVDFLACCEHLDDVWRSRGLGDAVNATNTFSRKLGDCDFQSVPEKHCRAWEAHGGRLTRVYIEEHIRTLHRNISGRQQEWERIADLEEWKFSLNFVAHVIVDQPSGEELLDAFPCPANLAYLTFAEAWERAKVACTDHAQIIQLFNCHVVDRLNESKTPETVRMKFREFFIPGR